MKLFLLHIVLLLNISFVYSQHKFFPFINQPINFYDYCNFPRTYSPTAIDTKNSRYFYICKNGFIRYVVKNNINWNSYLGSKSILTADSTGLDFKNNFLYYFNLQGKPCRINVSQGLKWNPVTLDNNAVSIMPGTNVSVDEFMKPMYIDRNGNVSYCYQKVENGPFYYGNFDNNSPDKRGNNYSFVKCYKNSVFFTNENQQIARWYFDGQKYAFQVCNNEVVAKGTPLTIDNFGKIFFINKTGYLCALWRADSNSTVWQCVNNLDTTAIKPSLKRGLFASSEGIYYCGIDGKYYLCYFFNGSWVTATVFDKPESDINVYSDLKVLYSTPNYDYLFKINSNDSILNCIKSPVSNNVPYVYLKDKKFGLHEGDFRLMALNYGLNIRTKDYNDFWSCPNLHSYKNDDDWQKNTYESSIEKINSDFREIRSLGFSTVRIVGLAIGPFIRTCSINSNNYYKNGQNNSGSVDFKIFIKEPQQLSVGIFNNVTDRNSFGFPAYIKIKKSDGTYLRQEGTPPLNIKFESGVYTIRLWLNDKFSLHDSLVNMDLMFCDNSVPDIPFEKKPVIDYFTCCEFGFPWTDVLITNNSKDFYQNILTGIIKDIIKKAGDNQLKVIFLTGGGGGNRKPEYVDNFCDDYFFKLSSQLSSDENLLAYDLYNEPMYNNAYTDKKQSTDWINHLSFVIRKGDSNHLITLGQQTATDMLYYDFSLFNTDFISAHIYPDLDSDNKLNKLNCFNRVKSTMKWYSNVSEQINKPWIIGETGLNVRKDEQETGGCQKDMGTELEQSNYAEQTINYLFQKAKGSGYSWWTYSDTKESQDEKEWNHDDFFGLYSTNQSNAPSFHQLKKVAGGGGEVNRFNEPLVLNFKKSNPEEYPNNYYNYYKDSINWLTGYISDSIGMPVKDAVICCWDSAWKNPRFTYSQKSGSFKICSNSDISILMFSSSRKCQKTYYISGTNFNIGNITLYDYEPNKLCETHSNTIHFSHSGNLDEITLFLDPITKFLNVRNIKNNKIIKIEILNFTGKTIFIDNIVHSTSAIVNTEPFSEGVYFLKVYMQDYYKTIKFINTK